MTSPSSMLSHNIDLKENSLLNPISPQPLSRLRMNESASPTDQIAISSNDRNPKKYHNYRKYSHRLKDKRFTQIHSVYKDLLNQED